MPFFPWLLDCTGRMTPGGQNFFHLIEPTPPMFGKMLAIGSVPLDCGNLHLFILPITRP
jgi:hypothetical protein